MLISQDRSVSRCAVATSGVIINTYNQNTGKCSPSFAYIASQTHYSVSQVKKSIKKIVPKYILKLSKGHTGVGEHLQATIWAPKAIEEQTPPKDLKVVNFEVKDGELETYNPVNPAALQTINKTDMDLTRLKNLAVLRNKGINLLSVSQVDLEGMDRMGLLDKKWQQEN